jgi:hypothetical protein
MNSPIQFEPRAAVPTARERWQTIINEQRSSGMTVKAFCQNRGLAASSLFAWRRKLGAGARKERPFVEVKTTPAGRANGDDEGGGIELRLRGNRRLIVRRGFDRDLLIEVVGTLEGLS